MLNFVIGRLREPSTWAGFSVLALAAGLTDLQFAAIAQAGAGIAAVLAVFITERTA